MFDHVGFPIADLKASRKFYAEALKPLGIRILREGEGWMIIGKGEGQSYLWLGTYGKPPGPVHIAFAAENRAQVRAFYEAALRAGGKDNGPPGIRAHYHPDYYGAFVFDPDGNNIEAVCHKPEA
jgi:catechol 2,3-dioxygenase-like lactoylglutathione lyase family enzyme